MRQLYIPAVVACVEYRVVWYEFSKKWYNFYLITRIIAAEGNFSAWAAFAATSLQSLGN